MRDFSLNSQEIEQGISDREVGAERYCVAEVTTVP